MVFVTKLNSLVQENTLEPKDAGFQNKHIALEGESKDMVLEQKRGNHCHTS